jgi:transposase-like protein
MFPKFCRVGVWRHGLRCTMAIWLYLRFSLSLRDVEDLLAERGLAVSYETVGHADKGGRLSRSCGCYPLIHDQVERQGERWACEEVEER